MSNQPMTTETLRQEGLDILRTLAEGLLRHQIDGPFKGWKGGLACPADLIVHGCSSYTMLPFAFLYAQTHEEKYLHGALAVLQFTLNHQFEPGFWNNDETTTWKGVSAFVLMSLAETYRILAPTGIVTKPVLEPWYAGIDRAARWLTDNLDPKGWNINYVISGALAVHLAFEVTGKTEFADAAHRWMQVGICHINADGLIWGEMVESDDVPEMTIDPGYNLEMSLPAITLYGILAKDDVVIQAALKCLDGHLPFILPDGSLDVGWGIRGYKWTTAGSRTAHGLLMGLMPLMRYRPELRDRVDAHVRLLRSMTKDGVLANGPHFWHQNRYPYCLIPTTVKATGLAFGLRYLPETIDDQGVSVPSEDFIRHLKNPEVILVRSSGFSGSVSCVHYRAGKPLRRYASPTGGAISSLFHRDAGRIQLSSQSYYERVEPINMQEVPDADVSTPRIEWQSDGKLYTNLFDFDAKMELPGKATGIPFHANIQGRLQEFGGGMSDVRYQVQYVFHPHRLVKQYRLEGTQGRGTAQFIEPLVAEPNEALIVSSKSVTVRRGNRLITLSVGPDGKVVRREKTWVPAPGIWVTPIEIQPDNPSGDSISCTIEIACEVK